MTADEKLEAIRLQVDEIGFAEPETGFARRIGEILDGPEPGEVGRVDVAGMMPRPQIAVFATSLEIASVEHDDLGIILELAFDISGGGYAKVMIAAEVAPLLATAIIDARAAAEQASEQGRIERVTGRLWTPDG